MLADCPHCNGPLHRHCRNQECKWTICRPCALIYSEDKVVVDVEQLRRNVNKDKPK